MNLSSTGWPRGAAHPTEEMDVLPESQAGLLNAWAQLCLQCSTWRLHSEGDRLEGHSHLWGLHLPVVSDLKLMSQGIIRGQKKVGYYDIMQVLKFTFLPFPLLLSTLTPSSSSTPRGNVGLSAVCAYNMTAVEEVFSKGKYMQKATVEQSHTKWVRYNGITPSPRPGAVSSFQLE